MSDDVTAVESIALDPKIVSAAETGKSARVTIATDTPRRDALRAELAEADARLKPLRDEEDELTRRIDQAQRDFAEAERTLFAALGIKRD
jgi:hypothetical protein